MRQNTSFMEFMHCFSLCFSLPVYHTFTRKHEIYGVKKKCLLWKSAHKREYIVCLQYFWVYICTYAHYGCTVNIAKWCPLNTLHSSFVHVCVFVCCLAYTQSSYPALCAWLNHGALTHGCPSSNQICHVAKRGHQVAMLSGSAVPRRSPGRYPRSARRGGWVGQQMEGRQQQHTNDNTLITWQPRRGRCTTCY